MARAVRFFSIYEEFMQLPQQEKEDAFRRKYGSSVGTFLSTIELPGHPVAASIGINKSKIITDLEISRIGNLQLIFNIKDKSVSIDSFQINDDLQGMGLARNIMHNLVTHLQKKKYEQIELSAGSTVGGYAWAKFGFVPNHEEWEKLKIKMNRDFEIIYLQQLQEIKEGLRIVNFATRLLNNKNPESIWALAEIKFPVLPRLNLNDSPMLDKEGRMNLGKCLLLGRRWEGSLSLLPESKGLKKFNAYTQPLSMSVSH